MAEENFGLVHIRTPTYRRPADLRRCLNSLLAQDWPHWICDVYDDDQNGSAEVVCQSFGDKRIVYNRNSVQKFAAGNIDQCFTSQNPRNADYFVVVEDDNYLLPPFLSENIALCRREKVGVLLRNQFVGNEESGSTQAISADSVLGNTFVEGLYKSEEFKLSLLFGIGVSNGGLFWSRGSKTDFEIGLKVSATLHEYLRTLTLLDDIYVAMEPHAVWSDNATTTTRNDGAKGMLAYIRRELNLKRAVQYIQRAIWRQATENRRAQFRKGELFAVSIEERERCLTKALILSPFGSLRGLKSNLILALRGINLRLFGRPSEEFKSFVRSYTAPR